MGWVYGPSWMDGCITIDSLQPPILNSQTLTRSGEKTSAMNKLNKVEICIATFNFDVTFT